MNHWHSVIATSWPWRGYWPGFSCLAKASPAASIREAVLQYLCSNPVFLKAFIDLKRLADAHELPANHGPSLAELPLGPTRYHAQPIQIGRQFTEEPLGVEQLSVQASL
jgi:hypothetical protein